MKNFHLAAGREQAGTGVENEQSNCYGVTVERGCKENSGSDVPVQRGARNERTRVKVSLIAKVHVC